MGPPVEPSRGGLGAEARRHPRGATPVPPSPAEARKLLGDDIDTGALAGDPEIACTLDRPAGTTL